MFKHTGRNDVYITLDTLENKLTNRMSFKTLSTEYYNNQSQRYSNMRDDKSMIRNIITNEFEKMILPFQRQFSNAINELDNKFSFLSNELSLL